VLSSPSTAIDKGFWGPGPTGPMMSFLGRRKRTFFHSIVVELVRWGMRRKVSHVNLYCGRRAKKQTSRYSGLQLNFWSYQSHT